MKRVLVIFAFGIGLFARAEGPKCDFNSESAVRSHFKPRSNALIADWLEGASARGGTFKSAVSVETRWYDSYTHNYLYRDFYNSMYTISRQGTVIAVPVSDWHEVQTFTYRQFNDKVVTGKLVTVTMQLCIPNVTKPPMLNVCEGVVRNIAESGLSIPDCVGMSGHVQALKKTAKERFGASGAEVYYRDLDGTDLKILLFNCVEQKAKKDIGPIKFDGKKGGMVKPAHKDHGDPFLFGRDREPDSHKAVRSRWDNREYDSSDL